MDNDQPLSENSIRLLLREHERICELFIENRQMGERRTSLYLTLIAATTPVLAALGQYTRAEFITTLHVVAMGVLLALGFLTFYRLIERRVETINLLRAINRIHRYFVEHDPALANYLTWKADEQRLTYVEYRGTLPGLRDLVQAINPGLCGLVIASALSLVATATPFLVLLVVGLAAAALAFAGQQCLENYYLARAEARARAG